MPGFGQCVAGWPRWPWRGRTPSGEQAGAARHGQSPPCGPAKALAWAPRALCRAWIGHRFWLLWANCHIPQRAGSQHLLVQRGTPVPARIDGAEFVGAAGRFLEVCAGPQLQTGGHALGLSCSAWSKATHSACICPQPQPARHAQRQQRQQRQQHDARGNGPLGYTDNVVCQRPPLLAGAGAARSGRRFSAFALLHNAITCSLIARYQAKALPSLGHQLGRAAQLAADAANQHIQRVGVRGQVTGVDVFADFRAGEQLAGWCMKKAEDLCAAVCCGLAGRSPSLPARCIPWRPASSSVHPSRWGGRRCHLASLPLRLQGPSTLGQVQSASRQESRASSMLRCLAGSDGSLFRPCGACHCQLRRRSIPPLSSIDPPSDLRDFGLTTLSSAGAIRGSSSHAHPASAVWPASRSHPLTRLHPFSLGGTALTGLNDFARGLRSASATSAGNVKSCASYT